MNRGVFFFPTYYFPFFVRHPVGDKPVCRSFKKKGSNVYWTLVQWAAMAAKAAAVVLILLHQRVSPHFATSCPSGRPVGGGRLTGIRGGSFAVALVRHVSG